MPVAVESGEFEDSIREFAALLMIYNLAGFDYHAAILEMFYLCGLQAWAYNFFYHEIRSNSMPFKHFRHLTLDSPAHEPTGLAGIAWIRTGGDCSLCFIPCSGELFEEFRFPRREPWFRCCHSLLDARSLQA
jgi:hypothetical protein